MRRGRAGLRRVRLRRLVWLTAVWVLMWGEITTMTVLGGVLVAVLVTVAFPLPPMPGRLSVRPLRVLRLAGYLAVELVVSGVQVSWETLRYGPRATAGIVAVPLLTDSPYLLAMTANVVSVTPGEFVLEIDRGRGLCYVYRLGIRAPTDAERVRRQMLAQQRRVIAALGSPDEVAALPDTPGGAR